MSDEPKVVQIVDQMIENLTKINRGKDPTWRVTLAHVGYGPRAANMETNRPAVYVEPVFWRQTAAGAQNQHNAELDLRLTCLSADTREPAKEIVRLVTDVIRCILQAETLNRKAIFVYPVEWEAGSEFVSGAGRGTAVLTCRAIYRGDHTAL